MKREVEVKVKYNTRVKQYPNGQIEIVRYKSDNLRKLENGYEKVEDEFKYLFHGVERNSDMVVRSDSIYRAKNKLIDYAIANREDWKSFVTLTFADNITDIKEANKKFNSWVKMVRRVFKDFKYLGVPEFQKRGAVHYHFLTNIPCGSDLIPIMPVKRMYSEKKDRYYNIYYYDIKYWKHGFSSIFDIIRETDSDFKLELYLTKYMFCDKEGNKNIDNRLWGHNKLLHSNNLKCPELFYYDLSDQEYDSLLNVYEDRINEKKELHSVRKFVPDRTITTII